MKIGDTVKRKDAQTNKWSSEIVLDTQKKLEHHRDLQSRGIEYVVITKTNSRECESCSAWRHAIILSMTEEELFDKWFKETHGTRRPPLYYDGNVSSDLELEFDVDECVEDSFDDKDWLW